MLRKLSDHAIVGKCIRKELKAAFPGVKFRVYGQAYSGGNSVRVCWENGATVEAVKNIVDKYQYGSFNGMEDIYEHDNKHPELEAQVKYVQVQRDISDAAYLSMRDKYHDTVGLDLDVWSPKLLGTVRQFLRRELSNVDLTNVAMG